MQAQKSPKLAPEIRCDPTEWSQGMALACAVTPLAADQPQRAILNNKTFLIMFAVLGAWQSRDEAGTLMSPAGTNQNSPGLPEVSQIHGMGWVGGHR